MPGTVAEKLIASHLVEGTMEPGETIGLRADQTLTQDATGTTVMLEFEALGLDRVRTEVSAQYIDHNVLQTDFKNADDHVYLQSACAKYGVWFSPPGNGVSHPVHMERFGIPGKSLVGSDSHTCAAGSMGMLAIGFGGLDVALAMAGEPVEIQMPEVWGIELTGQLPDWVSAKDVILELLRRHGVKGGWGRVLEFHGEGLEQLSAMDRHVIANMGQELNHVATVFPSDEQTRFFLRQQGREDDWQELKPDADATYDVEETIDLSELEPLVALPSSPGNVVPVADVAGKEVYQCYVGSSANPGLRDFAVPALMVEGRKTKVLSFDINPTSRQILQNMAEMGYLGRLIQSGARIHQAGCNGCIGMGQAPATESISLRTVPRNYPGRSGTKDDQVYLVSPETATASALTGVITDPRDLDMPYPRWQEPERITLLKDLLVPPARDGAQVKLRKGPNVADLPPFEPIPSDIEAPVLLKVYDNVSTDEIMPAGARALPFRSNIPRIAQFAFWEVDETYHDRALGRQQGGHIVVGGDNYGQGSSREHAAMAPRYLGLQVVVAKSFARIHWRNLCNFGVLPLEFTDPADYEDVQQDHVLHVADAKKATTEGEAVMVTNLNTGRRYETRHRLKPKQVEILWDGGIIRHFRKKEQAGRADARPAR